MDKENFSKWLQHQLDLREWSQADLSRKSGVSTGQIARLMTGERGIGEQSVIAIAKALKIPPVHVLEAAGILTASGTRLRSNTCVMEAIHTLYRS